MHNIFTMLGPIDKSPLIDDRIDISTWPTSFKEQTLEGYFLFPDHPQAGEYQASNMLRGLHGFLGSLTSIARSLPPVENQSEDTVSCEIELSPTPPPRSKFVLTDNNTMIAIGRHAQKYLAEIIQSQLTNAQYAGLFLYTVYALEESSKDISNISTSTVIDTLSTIQGNKFSKKYLEITGDHSSSNKKGEMKFKKVTFRGWQNIWKHHQKSAHIGAALLIMNSGKFISSEQELRKLISTHFEQIINTSNTIRMVADRTLNTSHLNSVGPEYKPYIFHKPASLSNETKDINNPHIHQLDQLLIECHAPPFRVCK